ncbi:MULTISPECIES: aspartyl-phosphate phosphatase Spo0E family protein [Bacillaceae]|uniref:aspartyl-phosphate phosphatase Spo0E family protein n=1 Tax=Bacillaceae TaxID=186817 RepID=UPI00037FB626|nr:MULTISPECIES: aspartyl-phosphate phosphatase Spo0E family protein [Bacillaceae]
MSDNKLKGINTQIEKLRTYLNELTKEKSLSDPEVVETSQMLDALLNEYDRLNNSRL